MQVNKEADGLKYPKQVKKPKLVEKSKQVEKCKNDEFQKTSVDAYCRSGTNDPMKNIPDKLEVCMLHENIFDLKLPQ
jgi:hypothetical protein